MDPEPKFTRSNAAGVLQVEEMPAAGFLVVPSALSSQSLSELVKFLRSAGRNPCFFAFEEKDLDPAVAAEVAAIGSIIRLEPETMKAEFDDAFAAGMVSIFLPRAAQMRVGGSISTPPDELAALLGIGRPVLPLFTVMAADQRLGADPGVGEPELYLSFGRLLEGESLTLPALQEAMLLAGEAAFSRKPFLKGHLGRALISGIKRYGSKVSLFDGTDDSELRYDKVLAAALALSRVISKETQNKRIGIILPPGKGAVIANLAVALAGKVPVNLNFTASHEAINSAIRQAGLDKFVTADPFVRRMPGFPWPRNRDLILIDRIMPALKAKIVRWLIVSKLLPARTLADLIGLPRDAGDDEATMIFTSGSSGEPKGVPLTHRNILANCTQFGVRLGLTPEDRGLGCLPLFHSFGFTVTLWYPLLEGISWVFYPNPMDAPKLAELVQKHRCTIMLSTATFLRGFFRRVKREQLATLKYTVVGAEKLPIKVAEAFHGKFGKDVFEGYGLTETSPVTNFNLPDPEATAEGQSVVPSHRLGTVGHPVSGLAVRIAHPDTGEFQPVDQPGIVCLKGANVFHGYFNDPARTGEAIRGGWFFTGDIGRIDPDGFLVIEGRTSRFSKIAGEMVPHETLEETIIKALGLELEFERKVAVSAVPDEKKGEAIVLLSCVCGETLGQEVIDLRYKLIDLGIPSLWTPKDIIPVEEIPLLASGKLDIKACQLQACKYLGLAKGEA